jgi:hypothetical protein
MLGSEQVTARGADRRALAQTERTTTVISDELFLLQVYQSEIGNC